MKNTPSSDDNYENIFQGYNGSGLIYRIENGGSIEDKEFHEINHLIKKISYGVSENDYTAANPKMKTMDSLPSVEKQIKNAKPSSSNDFIDVHYYVNDQYDLKKLLPQSIKLNIEHYGSLNKDNFHNENLPLAAAPNSLVNFPRFQNFHNHDREFFPYPLECAQLNEPPGLGHEPPGLCHEDYPEYENFVEDIPQIENFIINEALNANQIIDNSKQENLNLEIKSPEKDDEKNLPEIGYKNLKSKKQWKLEKEKQEKLEHAKSINKEQKSGNAPKDNNIVNIKNEPRNNNFASLKSNKGKLEVQNVNISKISHNNQINQAIRTNIRENSQQKNLDANQGITPEKAPDLSNQDKIEKEKEPIEQKVTKMPENLKNENKPEEIEQIVVKKKGKKKTKNLLGENNLQQNKISNNLEEQRDNSKSVSSKQRMNSSNDKKTENKNKVLKDKNAFNALIINETQSIFEHLDCDEKIESPNIIPLQNNVEEIQEKSKKNTKKKKKKANKKLENISLNDLDGKNIETNNKNPILKNDYRLLHNKNNNDNDNGNINNNDKAFISREKTEDPPKYVNQSPNNQIIYLENNNLPFDDLYLQDSIQVGPLSKHTNTKVNEDKKFIEVVEEPKEKKNKKKKNKKKNKKQKQNEEPKRSQEHQEPQKLLSNINKYEDLFFKVDYTDSFRDPVVYDMTQRRTHKKQSNTIIKDVIVGGESNLYDIDSDYIPCIREIEVGDL